MAELVALALPPGPPLVTAIREVWASGDAAFVLDHRLPESEAAAIVRAMAPGYVIEVDGVRRKLDSGRPVEPGDALVVATSGTTGEPKGVVLTHNAIRASADITSEALAVDPASDRWLACLPPAHIGGISVITRALLTDTPLTVHSGFEPVAVVDSVARGVTLVSVVTRALRQIATEGFRRILTGGGPPPPSRPPNVIATYGMTETGSGIAYDGRALRGVELRTADDDQIEVRSPTLFRSYRDGVDPKTTDGWFRTGDLGSLGHDGQLDVWGRADDVIITGGEKVWPHRVEAVLTRNPALADAAVTGRADADWGQVVTACVVLESGATAPTLAELRDQIRAELPAWYAPRDLELRATLPRTSNGKLRRDEL